MDFVVLSFFAGMLTVFAPCVFTLLPITLGSSLEGGSKFKSYRVVGSLVASIFLFTLLLRVSSEFLNLPYSFWKIVSASIIIMYGVITIYPTVWEKFKIFVRFPQSEGLGNIKRKSTNSVWVSDVLIGASLGPVFSSCSPTYALIIAIILPVSFLSGILNLIVYLSGLGLILLLISYLGHNLTNRLKWIANPNGFFRKLLGILFIIIGTSILLGLDKELETYLIREGIYKPSQIEIDYIQRIIN